MASMRDIKRRKTSIQGTQQITKAMKLVSTVKLQRARAGAERSQTYFDCMYDTVNVPVLAMTVIWNTNILFRGLPRKRRSLSSPPTGVWQVVTIPT